MRWLVASIWLVGCDQTWGLVHVGDPPIDGPLECPAKYDLRIGASSYWRSDLEVRWDTAEQQCEMDRMGIARATHLVVLTDETERLGLYSLLEGRGVTKNVWIGFSDRRTENAFVWVTNEPVGAPPNKQTPPWAPAQPDNQAGNQDCVRLEPPNGSDPSLLDDVECIATFQFVCECDDWMPAPANF